MYLTFLNIFTSIAVIAFENGIYLQVIGLMLFNLSAYTLIAKNSFRNVSSYFILSSYSILLLIFGYWIQPIYLKAYLLAIIISLFIKLNSYPFTYWIIPIYKSINLNTCITIIILTKVVFLLIISKFYMDKILLPLIYLILIVGTLVSVKSKSIIDLIIYSGSMQIIYIINPIFFNNYYLFIIYSILYLISIYSLVRTISTENCAYLIRFSLISINIYMLIGIPPFIGFFSKLFVLFNLYLICPLAYYFYYLIIYIVSSIIISFVYFNYLHSNCNFAFFKSNYTLPKTVFYIPFSLLISPLFFSDFIL